MRATLSGDLAKMGIRHLATLTDIAKKGKKQFYLAGGKLAIRLDLDRSGTGSGQGQHPPRREKRRNSV